MVKVAAIQMASGPNIQGNLNEAKRLISDAVEQGAELVVLPENFSHMGMLESDILTITEDFIGIGNLCSEENSSQTNCQVQAFLSSLAKEKGIWIIGGTIPLKSADSDKVLSACLLFNDQGKVVERYNKIHLFDVDLGEKCGTYNESTYTQAGDRVVVVETPFGKLGMAICYDLRFPEIFRDMANQNVDIICIVSSFTATTGKAHWEILNRARAIENLSFVISSAQGGYHVNGRETFGDSMIVGPWGRIIDRLARGSGFAIAQIETSKLQTTRKKFPVLDHIRLPCSLK
ncbi:MAG: carbon-nitrogen hydrolase family protein [gamma proteobacterium symbiont of Taylorina sp.]|nr:carbon-nitrogen hydrolase family protein [gamma proteobacterium symbiont of Taylorina sp.]